MSAVGPRTRWLLVTVGAWAICLVATLPAWQAPARDAILLLVVLLIAAEFVRRLLDRHFVGASVRFSRLESLLAALALLVSAVFLLQWRVPPVATVVLGVLPGWIGSAALSTSARADLVRPD